MSLLYNCAFDTIITQTTAGTTDLEGEKVVDCAGYEGVLFIGKINAVTAAGELEMYAQYSDSTSTTDMVDDTGTRIGSTGAVTSTDWDDKLLLLDIYKPLKRYVSVHIDKATQASEISVVAIRYGYHGGDVSQSTEQFGVIDSGLFISPTT